ncbi:uncharacterized protein LOC126376224 isoform X2 [Pectinophora gossypiella]|uniref:uncharacterized protein LOC126376224 isoform X2 n=1 Tax=Pectinophora gossypiella TaxID=13191 RepID=UPI00214F5EAF|nr:uncharacterized protein LOC126376224 isoform X2 [Pectinophora gossypiella]
MEDEEQKVCPNCKREIPAVNFTIHTVHCARNIRVCPVCKEPVPQNELEEHHEKLHKLLPCKQCGEKVCGTDLEDHIRDSCAHTIKSCRFCELELPRRELPAHESYCGVRTEQCPECREWVMIKYRQLHLDSNHGFLRLDDDPVPQPKRELPKATNIKPMNVPKPTNIPLPSTSNGVTRPANFVKNTNILQDQPKTQIRYLGSSNAGPSTSSGLAETTVANVSRAQTHNVLNGNGNNINKAPLKRTNDQPQINTAVAAVNKIDKELAVSRGAVKKRPAPKPPAREPPTAEPRRDLPYHSALQRHRLEEAQRHEQNAYNAAHGLPPVLTAAEKIEKLRKMDALQNRPVEEVDYKNRLQGRVWMDRTAAPAGQMLGASSLHDDHENTHLEVDRRRNRANPRNVNEDLKPMTPEQFMDRFKELQLRREDRNEGADRFSEIKSSLRELRRGLNEVTAPYNANNANVANNGERRARASPLPPDEEDVPLPCEFCGAPVPASTLVQHQTGCRPDLAQYRPHSPSPRSASPANYEDPVIPCEFCTESLPVYLISEHQERCGRDANLLYPD